MIIELFPELAAARHSPASSRPVFTAADPYLCADVDDVARDWPGNTVIACADCGAAIVDLASYPREPRKLCLACYGPRVRVSRA